MHYHAGELPTEEVIWLGGSKVRLLWSPAQAPGWAAALLWLSRKTGQKWWSQVVEREEAVRRIRQEGGEAVVVKKDVSSATEVENLLNQTVKTYGRLDCAFNSAGDAGHSGCFGNGPVVLDHTTLTRSLPLLV